ncbi:hypothetical protein D9M71_542800 [compost metagenome]
MVSGGRPSAPVSITAPISRRGLATRFIGRLDSEASPVRVVSNGWAASRPLSRRMEVPELPRYSGPGGGFRPCRPTPWMVTRPWCGPSMTTPMSRKACRVARASSPSRKPSTSVVPSAREPSMMERWEMDLSPGTRMRPASLPPGCAR